MAFTAFPMFTLLIILYVLRSPTTTKPLVSRPILSFSFALLDEM